jgi:Glycosyl transferases group 1
MKVLLLSQRLISNLVAYCAAYELEDTLADVTDHRRIDVADEPSLDFARRTYRFARLASGSPRIAGQIAPRPRTATLLEDDYDLFFPVFNSAYELYSLAAIPNWRQRCRTAACYITEVGSDVLPEYLVELLAEFDHIFLGSLNGFDEFARITQRPCTWLPLAVDAIRFNPGSVDLPRPIFLTNIGRRSPVTHQALLAMTAQDGRFYHYDTVASTGPNLRNRTFRVDSASEHRRMLATFLKHSSYFIANRGYVNKPQVPSAFDEISARFYEGAAAGAVMIGEAPRTELFKRQFDWPDAIIHVPFDSPDIARMLAEIDADTGRLRAIRCNNIREITRRHDWLHRIQTVFEKLGLATTASMQSRAQRLAQLSSEV